ncbi:MAG: LTA synthase family protein [Stagnimonas sp.]|nr:LTA synthase family protein [Stagnimonas sp.]
MSPGLVCWLLGIGLLLAGWQLARRVADTPWRWSRALAVDAVLPLLIFTSLLALSARPLFAGVVSLAMGAGWARADRDKRRVLREPIVFSDIAQALDMLRHPKLALPFPNTGALAALALTAITLFAALLLWEAPAWHGLPWLPVAVPPALVLLTRAAPGLPLSTFAQRLSLDPARDSARHGPFATILLYTLLAARERPARQQGHVHAPGAESARRPTAPTAAGGPVVLIQNESFFDLRRLHPAIPRDLLPNFARCCAEAQQWGRLAVPSWGANTVRTEFAVLTGLSQQALGFDRFNPYLRFVSRPIASLAWTLRAEGYRTICLHPFDRQFYRRDLAMPLLGFDEFLGEEQFADAARINGYVADIEVARVAERLLREHGPKLFLFIITMENHGPWSGAARTDLANLPELGLSSTEQQTLGQYAASLVNADSMLGLLSGALARWPQPGVLGFYGDHLPSLPGVNSRLPLDEAHSDYLVWNSALPAGGLRRDIAAEDLAAALVTARRVRPYAVSAAA